MSALVPVHHMCECFDHSSSVQGPLKGPISVKVIMEKSKVCKNVFQPITNLQLLLTRFLLTDIFDWKQQCNLKYLLM